MRFAVCVAVAILHSGAAAGQSTNSQIKFEIAAIQPSAPSTRTFMSGPYLHPDRYEIRNATMVDLVRTAYGIDPDKVSGGPNWLEFDRFDLIAKVPAGTQANALKTMLQDLLAERFKLVVHSDTKQFPAYALSLGKTPRLKEADASSAGSGGCSFRGNSSPPLPGATGPGGPMILTMSCHSTSLTAFANSIRGFVGTSATNGGPPQVIDKTELKGVYDLDLKITMDNGFGGSDSAFIDAIDKQLGLKLETIQVPMPVIVVEKVNRKPGDNPPDAAKSFPPLPTEFEVVSLKPGTPLPLPTPGRGNVRTPPYQNDRVNLQNNSVRQLINLAWNLTPADTIAGAPKWLDSDHYDLVAKVPVAAAPAGRGPVDIDAYRPMFKAVLEDRFQMKVHFEDRPTDVYVLTAVKPKLQKADPANRTKWTEGPGPDGKDPRKTNQALNRLICFQNVTMAQFAALLPVVAGGYLRTPALDNTGLDGGWDFTLSFSAAGMVNGMSGRGGDAGPNAAVPSASEPSGGLSLFDAINKQLGLKLVTQKRPMPTLVIDHIEQKPADN